MAACSPCFFQVGLRDGAGTPFHCARVVLHVEGAGVGAPLARATEEPTPGGSPVSERWRALALAVAEHR